MTTSVKVGFERECEGREQLFCRWIQPFQLVSTARDSKDLRQLELGGHRAWGAPGPRESLNCFQALMEVDTSEEGWILRSIITHSGRNEFSLR